MAFAGFPPDAVTFFSGLEADNSKLYWTANKETYERSVRQPMLALLAAIDDDFQPMRMFRPHRDVRFSKDKSPYKTHAGASGERQGGAMYYLQISGTGLFVATGYYMCAPDQLVRLRAAIDQPATGAELERILATLKRKGHDISGESLKTAPKGYPRDHPRIELLRMKWLTAGKTFGAPRWLHTKAALAKVQQQWREAEPLNAWLDTHVGPSTRPPESEREVW